MCNAETNMRIRRQRFWAPKKVKLKPPNRIGVQGSQVNFRAPDSVHGWGTLCKAPDIFPPRWCFGKPVTQCSFGPRSNVSSFLACTSVQGFQQVRQQNWNCGKNHVQVMLSSLIQEKMSSVPKEVTLHQCNHLKAVQRKRKHQDTEDESNQRFIISSAALIRMTAAYCHKLVLVSRCQILITSHQIWLPGKVGGVWTETTSGWLYCHTAALFGHLAEHLCRTGAFTHECEWFRADAGDWCRVCCYDWLKRQH